MQDRESVHLDLVAEVVGWFGLVALQESRDGDLLCARPPGYFLGRRLPLVLWTGTARRENFSKLEGPVPPPSIHPSNAA